MGIDINGIPGVADPLIRKLGAGPVAGYFWRNGPSFLLVLIMQDRYCYLGGFIAHQLAETVLEGNP